VDIVIIYDTASDADTELFRGSSAVLDLKEIISQIRDENIPLVVNDNIDNFKSADSLDMSGSTSDSINVEVFPIFDPLIPYIIILFFIA